MSHLNHEVNDSNVIPFPDSEQAFMNPEEIADKEILERFIAQLNHPSAPKEPSQLAEFVIDTAGTKAREGLTKERQRWRDRITRLQHNTPALSDSQYDAIVDPHHEEYDEPFAELERSLRVTLPRAKDMKAERQALSALINLRIAAIHEKTDDDAYWIQLAKRLTRERNS